MEQKNQRKIYFAAASSLLVILFLFIAAKVYAGSEFMMNSSITFLSGDPGVLTNCNFPGDPMPTPRQACATQYSGQPTPNTSSSTKLCNWGDGWTGYILATKTCSQYRASVVVNGGAATEVYGTNATSASPAPTPSPAPAPSPSPTPPPAPAPSPSPTPPPSPAPAARATNYKTIDIVQGTVVKCDPETFDELTSEFPCIDMTPSQETKYAKSAAELAKKIKEKEAAQKSPPPAQVTQQIIVQQENCKNELELTKSNAEADKRKIISYGTTITKRYATDRELLESTKNKVDAAQKKLDEIFAAAKTGTCPSDMANIKQKGADVAATALDLEKTRTTYTCRILGNRQKSLSYSLSELKNPTNESVKKLEAKIQGIVVALDAACKEKDDFALVTVRISLTEGEQDLKAISEKIPAGGAKPAVVTIVASRSSASVARENFEELADTAEARAALSASCKPVLGLTKQIRKTAAALAVAEKKGDTKKQAKLLAQGKKREAAIIAKVKTCDKASAKKSK